MIVARRTVDAHLNRTISLAESLGACFRLCGVVAEARAKLLRCSQLVESYYTAEVTQDQDAEDAALAAILDRAAVAAAETVELARVATAAAREALVRATKIACSRDEALSLWRDPVDMVRRGIAAGALYHLSSPAFGRDTVVRGVALFVGWRTSIRIFRSMDTRRFDGSGLWNVRPTPPKTAEAEAEYVAEATANLVSNWAWASLSAADFAARDRALPVIATDAVDFLSDTLDEDANEVRRALSYLVASAVADLVSASAARTTRVVVAKWNHRVCSSFLRSGVVAAYEKQDEALRRMLACYDSARMPRPAGQVAPAATPISLAPQPCTTPGFNALATECYALSKQVFVVAKTESSQGVHDHGDRLLDFIVMRASYADTVARHMANIVNALAWYRIGHRHMAAAAAMVDPSNDPQENIKAALECARSLVAGAVNSTAMCMYIRTFPSDGFAERLRCPAVIRRIAQVLDLPCRRCGQNHCTLPPETVAQKALGLWSSAAGPIASIRSSSAAQHLIHDLAPQREGVGQMLDHLVAAAENFLDAAAVGVVTALAHEARLPFLQQCPQYTDRAD